MDEKFTKPYDPAATEGRIYEAWEKSGYFNPDALPPGLLGRTEGKPFVVMMPPPNATGELHVGHALGLTVQDALIRFKRLQGYAALWLPGTDHAAIATQSRVEKDIAKNEKKSRYDLGREELVRRIDAFVEKSRGTIRNQIRVMGSSCDWSREAFTLDAARNRAVNELFKRMYDAGLVYRGHRIVNWDPKGQTTISDDEIVHEERTGKLYTLRYSKDFPIPIATTRPETKLGDTAVAVHPDDARYKEYIGKTYEADFAGAHITVRIVGDEAVDPAFGTGAVGVTPAHSQTDWEIKDRHALPVVQVIDERGRMTVGHEDILGRKTAEAREAVVEWLRSENLLENEEDTMQNISTAERTGGVIEPLPKLQWWVDTDKPFRLAHSEIPGIPSNVDITLKQMLRAMVAERGVRIIPEHFEKTYFHWIDNLRPWCISRQIWYGHRVPVWYRGEEVVVGGAPAGEGWTQDEDTLDTWFSSGSWTFSTLGWPDKTSDLERFHPTSLLETGYDILFFWIARMMLMSGFALGQVPFKDVYLHGIVRDTKGRKFSKSLGNGIDPIDMVEKFGTDALRMSLLVGNTPGTDGRLSEDKIKGYKHFANKLWNIARFILENTDEQGPDAPVTEQDAALRDALVALAAEITTDMEEYHLHMAAEKLYHYVWGELAGVILEESKPILAGEDALAKASREATLRHLLETVLVLLHPFMPFVTEEIWQSLPKGAAGSDHRADFVMIAPWPITADAKP
ncbi:MAG TPA: valine--tRNA ligase [Candidatus Paceibacterota bacterium]|nr:valine--tRNA ligase [Candidatus Paceibacterota bacterium]